MPEKMSRKGLTVVITGASSGFGKGIAEKLSADGANVVLAARRTELIEKLAKECGPHALAVTADVSKQEDMEHLTEAAVKNFGKIDVWINNAGLGIIGPFTETPLADLVRLMEINLLGMMYGSHFALSHFKREGSGILINMSSFVSQVPLPYGAVYTASKCGITGLSAGLNLELELEGWKDIHVCAVHPWVTDTPWIEHAGNYSGHEIRLGPADDAEKVIGTVIALIDKPEKTVELGIKPKSAVISHHLAPELTEKLNGALLLAMLQKAPHAANTSGSLHIPQPEGTEVSGVLREKIEEKD